MFVCTVVVNSNAAHSAFAERLHTTFVVKVPRLSVRYSSQISR